MNKPTPIDAYALSRVVAGQELNGERERLSAPFRRMVDHLDALALDARPAAWSAMLAVIDNWEALVQAAAKMDPLGPPPDPESETGDDDRCATLAELRLLVSNTAWPWPGWLAGGALNALAADPGVGKTTVGMELARRLWFGEPWPDGQENPFPTESRTLWIPGDRHYGQLIDLAGAYGLPDEAVMFNAPLSNAEAMNLELDDAAALDALKRRIVANRPAIVIVDTVGMTTSMNLCRPEDARDYFGPMMDMATQTETAFLVLTHLSKGGEALGRRIVSACRTVWKITAPDPDGQRDRRRLWVDKSYGKPAPPLGMTIADAGCEFDSSPPTAPEMGAGGRPPESREKAERFILDALATDNDQKARDLCARWEADGGKKTSFWDARDALVRGGKIVQDGKPFILHLRATRDGDPEW